MKIVIQALATLHMSVILPIAIDITAGESISTERVLLNFPAYCLGPTLVVDLRGRLARS